VIWNLRSRTLLAIVLCAAFLSLSIAAPAPEVKVDIQATPQKATVGDPISLRLDVQLPQGYQVTLPKLGDNVGDFAILDFPPGKVITTGQGSDQSLSKYEAQIVVALYKPGEFEFPQIEMTLRGTDGSENKISSPAVKITIQSILTEKDQNLKQLKKQAEIQEPVRWVMWLLIACLVLILAAIGIWLWRRRRRPNMPRVAEPDVDPIAMAESDLRDLLRRGLLENGLTKQFYVSLSEIVRRILEAGFQIQTLEKTTSEILEELKLVGNGKGTGHALGTIESVLTECDLVKFAKYIPSQPETREAVESSFEILALAKKMKQPAVVAETSPVQGVS
jgi:hypothetical protein